MDENHSIRFYGVGAHTNGSIRTVRSLAMLAPTQPLRTQRCVQVRENSLREREREHAQAEERYIKANGKVRANTKWPEFGALQPKLWNTDSILDFVAPALCVVLMASYSDAVIGALQTLIF